MDRKRRARSKRKLKFLAIFVVILSCGIFAILITWLPYRSTQPVVALEGPVELPIIRLYLGRPITVSDAGIIVAESAGFFRRDGLGIQILPQKSDSEAILAAANDSNAVAIVPARALLLGRAQNQPVVAFSASRLESSIVFYSLSKIPIRTPSDFEGKAVGYRNNSDSATVYQALLARNQISRARLREITTDIDLPALLNGTIDILPGSIEIDSYYLRAAGAAFDTLRPGRFGIHTLGTVFLTHEANLARNPDLLRRFLRAVADGWERAYQDYNLSLPVIAAANEAMKDINLLRLSMDEQRELIRPLGARFGEFDRQRWTELQTLLLQQRQLAAPIDLSSAYTFEVLRNLHRRSSSTD